MRIFRIFCKHDYGKVGDLRDFFGIIKCKKCGKFSRLPDDQMEVSTFSFNIETGTIKKEETNE